MDIAYASSDSSDVEATPCKQPEPNKITGTDHHDTGTFKEQSRPQKQVDEGGNTSQQAETTSRLPPPVFHASPSKEQTLRIDKTAPRQLKRRRQEGSICTVGKPLSLIPPQVQFKRPNVSTEDLASFGNTNGDRTNT